MERLKLGVSIEQWPLVIPFRITGYTWDVIDTLLVTLERSGAQGRGEASGVYYRGEDVGSMRKQIEELRPTLEAGVTREMLQTLLPPGGARNALDCALWDLEAKLSGRPVWQIAGVREPRPIQATFTCGADDPEKMAAAAVSYRGARAIKLKLTGEPADGDRVRAVREARADVVLRVDANQGFTRASLETLMPVMEKAQVELVEQPFPVGQEALLDGFQWPIPIAADESVQCLADMGKLAGRFQVINIKLEKCGGLTEALAMVHRARSLGLGIMVGNMLGTSLAMAPGFLLGQSCDIVELDGPLTLKADRPVRVRYVEGLIECPPEIWGAP
jgi:L-Ala-D/L-Glu epimerase / N-acetyl-D-glutamate racemase